MINEKLNVYQRSLDFIEWASPVLEKLNKSMPAAVHLDDSSASIVLNIAEGNGRYSSKDRCKYFDISRSSALECAGCIDVLLRKNKITNGEAADGKKILSDIIAMLVGLIRSNSDRAHEQAVEYGVTNKEYGDS